MRKFLQVAEDLAEALFTLKSLAARHVESKDTALSPELLCLFLLSARGNITNTHLRVQTIPVSLKALQDLAALSPNLKFLAPEALDWPFCNLEFDGAIQFELDCYLTALTQPTDTLRKNSDAKFQQIGCASPADLQAVGSHVCNILDLWNCMTKQWAWDHPGTISDDI